MKVNFFKSIEKAINMVEDESIKKEAFIDLDKIKSVFSIAQEEAQEEYTEIEIDIDEDILNILFYVAHNKNITLNKLVNNILKEFISIKK